MATAPIPYEIPAEPLALGNLELLGSVAPEHAEISSFRLKLADAEAIQTIDDDDARILTMEVRRDVLNIMAKLEEHHFPLVNGLHRAHKLALARQTEVIAPFKESAKRLNDLCAAYDDALRKKRAEEARRKREEEERARAEQQRRADELALRLAQEAEAQHKPEVAEQILEQRDQARAEEALTPTVEVIEPVKPMPKAVGESTRKTYRIEVEDPLEAVKAIIANDVLFGMVVEDFEAAIVKRLKPIVTAQRDNFRLAGCRAVAETSLAVRR